MVVLLAAALPLLLTESSDTDAYLDPRDTSLDGSAALAALLRDRGVRVVPVDSVEEAAESGGPATRVLVSRPEALTDGEARGLAAMDANLLVIGSAHADIFLAARSTQPAPSASLSPGCDLRAAVRAGSAHLGGASFHPETGTTRCYRVGGRPTLVTAPATTQVSSGEFMTNRRLDEDGNAALALNLAGADRRLVWLLPAEPAGAAAPPSRGGKNVGDLVPPQVPWAVATLGLAVVLTALWRGRRLGPVVVERLPVVVRATETVEGRGRLYRARRARQQAARALCAAAATRIANRLGLPTPATPAQVVNAVAARMGEDAQQVERLLYGEPPADDRALVTLADELDALERRLRQP